LKLFATPGDILGDLIAESLAYSESGKPVSL
jgi:hypothetical protein